MVASLTNRNLNSERDNPMSDEKYSLRNYVNIFVPLMIYVIISLMVEIAVASVLSFRYILTHEDGTSLDVKAISDMVNSGYAEYGSYISIAIALVCIPVFVFLYINDKKKDKAYERAGASFYVIVGIMGILACICFSNFVDSLNVDGFLKLFSQDADEPSYSGNTVAAFIASAICSPVLEELLFRGLLYGRMRRFGWKFASSAIVTGLIFASLHSNIMQAVYAFLIGTLFCYVFEKSKSIVAPVVMHLSANIFAFWANEFNLLSDMYEMDKMYFYFLNILLFFVLALIGRFVELRFVLKTIDRSEEEL